MTETPRKSRKTLSFWGAVALGTLAAVVYSTVSHPYAPPSPATVSAILRSAPVAACQERLRAGEQDVCDVWTAVEGRPGGVACRLTRHDPEAPRPEFSRRREAHRIFRPTPADASAAYDAICRKEGR